KSTFPMRVSINALPDDGSGIARFIGSCHDLSEFKQQETQLRRAQRMDALGKLTGGIAHDFNNLLGVVIGYSGLLERKLSAEPKLARHASQILHAAERGANLTNKLLGFSRQEELIAARVDVNALVTDQLEVLQTTLTVRIALKVNLGEQLWPVWLDNNDLQDALLNISINASHAMDESCRVHQLTISTSNISLDPAEAKTLGLRSGDYVRLSLADTGIGMDDETKESIFDPFFSTKGAEGTGLGLSQVFGFISRADGAIKVHSTLGVGTEFMLYFPRHIVDKTVQQDSPAQLDSADNQIKLGSNIQILVVDDEADLNELNVELLTEQGYQVFAAENSDQAWAILQQQDIDLIYCDVVMPGTDGFQLAERVQQQYPQIKIQMTSGFTGDLHVDISDQKLHQQMLYKPVNPQRMLERIQFLLSDRP
ncbi:MAG: response regulator, partial [Immundisolibacteraceae bacterium]|nr:response regulator [Immundisolibacteraceae bacterium]